MSKRYRLALMALSIVALFVVGWSINQSFSFVFNDFWFTAGLLLLIMLSLVDQPHFSKDSNVFVNAVTATLSLLLVPESERTPIFWAFFGIALYLIISSYALMWLRRKSLGEESVTVQFFSRLNRMIGRPEVIFSAFFLWGAVRQYSSTSSEFNALLWFWIIFMVLNIPTLASMIDSLFDKRTYSNPKEKIGEIIGVESGNTFLGKISSDIKETMESPYFVEFLDAADGTLRYGYVVETYLLDDGRWMKVFCSKEIEQFCFPVEAKREQGVIYKTKHNPNETFTERFIGILVAGSRIEKILFSYNSNLKVQQGQLLELTVDDRQIIYQITDAMIEDQRLEDKNNTSTIVGEAVQLGEWDSVEGRFNLYGWLPKVNTGVFLASDLLLLPTVEENEITIGTVPGSNYPVIMDKETAVTHHLAILGVTGTGKSHFSRQLIKELACDDLKVIVVDLTGEYAKYFKNIAQIISSADSKDAFAAIETLAQEQAKFANQRQQSIISANEESLKRSFYNSIKSFLEGAEKKAVFEIPDISNKSSIFEYVRWFFWVLFEIAKTQNSFGKRVCVVLEEAHTVVPEYNSMGSSDNASKASVNSIAQIALQGRKYDIGLIVIAQRTANVSKTILTQCNSIIAFQEFDKTSTDFLANYMDASHLRTLSTLKFRTGIAVGKAFKSTVPVLFEAPYLDDSPVEEGIAIF